MKLEQFLYFRCGVCKHPAIWVSGTAYWCPACGWRFKNDHKKLPVF